MAAAVWTKRGHRVASVLGTAARCASSHTAVKPEYDALVIGGGESFGPEKKKGPGRAGAKLQHSKPSNSLQENVSKEPAEVINAIHLIKRVCCVLRVHCMIGFM